MRTRPSSVEAKFNLGNMLRAGARTGQNLEPPSVIPLSTRSRELTGHKAAILQVIKARPMTAEEVAGLAICSSAAAPSKHLLGRWRIGSAGVANPGHVIGLSTGRSSLLPMPTATTVTLRILLRRLVGARRFFLANRRWNFILSRLSVADWRRQGVRSSLNDWAHQYHGN
jgi:hypothetical protein